ncbi:hypothetical protein PCH_Pc18g03780 [Penicillium rubens Wisconsin 54-1255]|uniref:Uncharacterized protein n=1 Tax=Penicillium rubens (strain ATCC 28089 / DSM 1075 / NRRL 1951 / Wisconsin 54-1255) TaxID=500485 RepID=B6HBE2_PENRW|nr:hypothetical protein PCH_Pc18g03780 [Penicillium rubens Wisconsin 54-1255]
MANGVHAQAGLINVPQATVKMTIRLLPPEAVWKTDTVPMTSSPRCCVAAHGIAFTENREPSRIELKNEKDNQDTRAEDPLREDDRTEIVVTVVESRRTEIRWQISSPDSKSKNKAT